MEITASDIYWLMQMDTIKHVLFPICIATGLVSAVLAGIGWIEDEDTAKTGFKILMPIFVIAMLLGTFLPSTKTLAAMYTVPAIVNNQDVQKIPQKVLDLANQKLDELLKGDK